MTPIPSLSPLWPAPDSDAPDLMLLQHLEAEAVVEHGQRMMQESSRRTMESVDALRTRLIAYKTLAGQLERLLTEHGIAIPTSVRDLIAIPTSVRDLNPDR